MLQSFKRFMTLLMIFSMVSFFTIQTFGQKKTVIEKTSADQRMVWYQEFLKMKNESIFKNLSWQFLGPTNISGRMTDVEVVTPKGKNYTIYVAGASGGIWKTENEGVNWKPVFEHAMSTALGDIALDPQDQHIIWAGTGEANIFRSSQAGAGIYYSKDAGENWEHKGLTNTNTISRIIVHPKNSNIVYVAASGNEWTNDEERGLYKTTDNGEHWEKIFYINEKTGVNDMVMDPQNPDHIYIATWQRIRKKWNDPRNEEDYEYSGIYETKDGGKTWTAINEGLPEAKFRGRIGIDLCQAKPNVLYAFVDNYEKLPEDNTLNQQIDAYGRPSSGRIKGATVFRSDNGGQNWIQTNEQNEYMEGLSGTYGWVFGQISVDPVNENKIYVMGLALNLSEDGGKTFKPLYGMHGDHHGLWIDPENTNYLVNVNDGGVAISYDGKNFRTFYNNLPLAQFFNVNYDMDTPFKVYGSIQDHGSYKGIVDLSQGRNKINAVEFKNAPGGEGSSHFIDPRDPNTVYSAGFYGSIQRTDVQKQKTVSIMPDIPEGVKKLRGQWLAPFILSPHNPQIIYHGTQFIHRSLDKGETWEKISPDLTYNHPDYLGDIPYQTIFSISESPLKFGLIYAGTDDGRVWVTKNNGAEWNEIIKGLPYQKWVSQITASQYDEATVYMSQNGKRDDDFAAYIWKSTNYGNKWIDITNNIPYGPVNVIREDPKNQNILYVGTDHGVYVSINGGESWYTLCCALPTTYVQDIIIHPRDNIMIAATHGRGLWALDVEYIQNLSSDVMNKNYHLYNIPEAQLPYNNNWWFDYTTKPAHISFFLKEPQEIEMSITDKNNNMVYKERLSADKGYNNINWDLYSNIDGVKQKRVSQGLYTFHIKGKSFEDKKSFSVGKFQFE